MDKPFLSFDKQIDKLIKEYNLIIQNRDFAYESLTSISYYDLINGYQSIYRSGDKYLPGTTMEQLVATHIFNKNIQGVIMKFSTYAENSYKNILANVIAEKFTEDQNEYLKIINYKRSRDANQRAKLKELLQKLLNYCNSCNDTPTLHYRLSKDHIPPWILFRNISFSDTADLFIYLNKNDKEYLMSFFSMLNTKNLNYDDKVTIMVDSLKYVRKIRNRIAHNLDFMTYRSCTLDKSANSLFTDTLILSNEKNKYKHDIWGMVLATIILLNNKYIIQNFLAEINSFLKQGGILTDIYCNITGIPHDYETRIIKHIDVLGLSQ